MPTSSIAGFWVVTLVLIIVPGADWAFIISAGLRGHSILAAVSGLALGYAAMTVVATAGVGAFLARSPAFLTALTIAGGFYLVWHGASTFARPATPATAADARVSTNRATLITGAGVSGLNPKGLLIFLALLPQFTNPHSSWPLPTQFGVLGLAFTLTCAAFYLSLGSSARKILHGHPAAARTITRFSGAAMIVVGGLLLTERLIT